MKNLIFHEIYGIPNLKETVDITFRNESSSKNGKYSWFNIIYSIKLLI